MTATAPRMATDSAAIAVRPSAKSVFPNGLQTKSRVPEFVWNLLRVGALGVWLTVAGLLIVAPDTGLSLLWRLVVPSVPLLLVFAPGLWRQVCPLALANQTPRLLGFSLGLTLPPVLQRRAFSIAFFVFFLVISWREPYFNHVGWATGVLLLGSLAAALAGGLLFKGRSGWCGTFCPLGPIQRVYGHAPLVVVPQTYCASCVGCQKNCYDFSPQAAVFDDMYDENPAYAGERRLFYAMLPGLLLGYFLATYSPASGYPLYALTLLASSLASVGVYQFLTSFFPVTPYRAAAVFAAAALTIFYFFCGPILLRAAFGLLHAGAPPDIALLFSQALGGVGAVGLLVSGLLNERRYRRAWWDAREAAAAGQRRTHWIAVEGRDEPLRAEHNQPLLSLLVAAECGVDGQCGAGQCGADAVEVLEGAGNLTPPGADEQATLARLGAGPATRLACSARVRGPVALRLPSQTASAPPPARVGVVTPLLRGRIPADRMAMASKPAPAPAKHPPLDFAREIELRRVLIIGGGVAGETVAQALREASPNIGLTLIAGEPTPFYDRIRLGKIVEGQATPEGLAKRPAGWHGENRIDLRLGVSALAIDRDRRQVRLSDGGALGYDKVVIATGARPRLPTPDFLTRQNAFVLHSLADATRIRSFLERRRPASCAVVGGGVLAIEMAESLARAGLRTTLVCRAQQLMAETIDSESAALLRRYLERVGIELRFGEGVAEWGDSAIRLAGGEEIGAEMFVACIGVEPNVELARAAGLDIGRAIRVDETMATSDPDIYAVGDVAERAGRASGLWSTAAAGARTAAAAMIGRPADYMPALAHVRLKSRDIELRAFGFLDAQPGDEVIVAPPFEPGWWRVVVREGVIIGACFVGAPGSSTPLWSLVQTAALSEAATERLREGNIEGMDAA